MDTLERLRIFLRVAESGSFSGTASELGVGQPTVSRAISALERRLGVRLMHRHTRGLSLTEEGSRAYEQSLRVLEQFEALVGARAAAPGKRRRIRVACPTAFGTLRLVQLMSGFSKAHPEVEVELTMSDAFVDLVEEGIDVAFRFGALDDSSLVARRLGWLPRMVVGSREYLRRVPPPKTPAELMQHACVVRGRERSDAVWTFGSPKGTTSVSVSGPLRVDNFLAVREAVLAGAGLALGGALLFYEGRSLHRSLQVVLPRYTLAPLPFHLVFQKDRFLPTRVRAFIDHFTAAVQQEPWLLPVG